MLDDVQSAPFCELEAAPVAARPRTTLALIVRPCPRSKAALRLARIAATAAHDFSRAARATAEVR